MAVQKQYFTLNTGQKMPVVGCKDWDNYVNNT
jgi:uncharacterized short protein YbdD (DUF466 family)